jgi:hypothetical protein
MNVGEIYFVDRRDDGNIFIITEVEKDENGCEGILAHWGHNNKTIFVIKDYWKNALVDYQNIEYIGADKRYDILRYLLGYEVITNG